jgi:phosphoglycolate phosphatase-like HAD superfamily hydrolase
MSVIALDFDGLICDGLHENMLVTWNSHHGKGIDAFGERGLGEIPAAFAARFLAARGFARHIGHFLVPLVTADPLRTQPEFDASYAAIGAAEVDDFVRGANDYRARARAARQAQWLGFHELYPGIHDLLVGLASSPYIVTAKDASSVLAILRAKRVDVDRARVFGELRSKLDTLSLIAEREGVDRADLIFVDDSIANVVGARRSGYDAHWATWGYNAPEHFELAGSEGVPIVALADMPELAARWS